MLTLAAIHYLCDQNEPSRPFLVELQSCTEYSTLDEIVSSLKDYVLEDVTEDYNSDPECREKPTLDDLLVETDLVDGNYGDITITDKEFDDQQYYFVLPYRVQKRLAKSLNQQENQ